MKKKDDGRRHVVSNMRDGLNAALNSDCNKIKLSRETAEIKKGTYEVFIGAIKSSTFSPGNVEKIRKHRASYKGRITKEQADAAGEAMSKGLSINHICQLFCVSRQAFFEWIKKGNADREAGIDSMYSYLVDCLEHGRAVFTQRNLEIIKEASEADPKLWASAAWLLEKNDPEHFGKRERIDVTNTQDEAFIKAVRSITPAIEGQQAQIDVDAGGAVPYEEENSSG